MERCVFRYSLVLVLWIGACDHGLPASPPEPDLAGRTGIAGRITFAGTWPEDVGQVAVAVYQDLPQTVEDLFNIKGWDTDVALNARTYDYFVELDDEGVYRWVVIAWRKPDSFWDFTSLLGCYHASGDSLPGTVAVTPGEVASGIDIAVDFGVLQGESLPGHTVCLRPLPPELVELAGGP